MANRITISGTSPATNVYLVNDHYEIFGDTNRLDLDDIFYFKISVPIPAGGIPSVTFGGAGSDLIRSPNDARGADYYGGWLTPDANGNYPAGHKRPPGFTEQKFFRMNENDGADEFDLGQGDKVVPGGGQDRVNWHIAGEHGYSTPGIVRGLHPLADGDQVGGPRAEGDVISAPHNLGFNITNVDIYNSETIHLSNDRTLFRVVEFDINCRDDSFMAGPTSLSDNVRITWDARPDKLGVGVNHITGVRTPGQSGGDDFQLWLTTDPREGITQTIFEWVRDHDAEYNPGGPDYQINEGDFFL